MSERTVYMAGHWLPESEAKVSVYDLSVMQAAASFEMTRSFNGKTFKLDEHLDRLENSCRLLGIPLALSKSAIHAVCDEIVDRHRDVFNPADEHRLLIVASPGCAPMYRELAGVIEEPYVYVTDFPLRYTVAGIGKQFAGATAALVSVQQTSDKSIPPSTKHRSRLHFHLAQLAAKERGVEWAFMLDERGNLAECPGANIILVKDGILTSPDWNCLNGISAATVHQLAQTLGYAWQLGSVGGRDRLRPHHVWEADEVFVTGTPFCMIPIVRVDNFMIGDGTPGPVYTRLLQAWSESVGMNIAEQIWQWDLADSRSFTSS